MIWIKELRTQAGLSQSQLAKELHLSLGAIHNYEQGLRDPSECMKFLITEHMENYIKHMKKSD